MSTLDFFTRIRDAVNSGAGYRKLGTADFSMIFAIGGERVKVVFEAFEITEVSDAAHLQDRDVDFVLAIPADLWASYLRQRANGSGTSLLSLDLDHSLVKARDPIARLGFERFNRSLQAFVDAGSTLAA